MKEGRPLGTPQPGAGWGLMPSRSFREIRWPFKGLHQGRSFHGQSPDTTVDCLNVRNFDPRTGRSRGAQRAGLSRYLDGASSANPIQDIISWTTVPTSAGAATTFNTRTLTNMSVCAGTVQTFTGSAFATVTNGSGALSSTAPVIFSAELFGKIYFADGVNHKYYDPSTGMQTWSAASGTFPASGANYPRLICNWRSRIVLSGLRGDDQNWFMSALGDATDWNYLPDEPSPTDAVAGNACHAGKSPDIVTSLVPLTDDLLLLGGDHSIWQLSGDPMAGGRIDCLSSVTGMPFGRPWANGPNGVLYFMGTKGGIYRLTPGQGPERLSGERVEAAIDAVNLDDTIVRAAYDDKTQGVHFFLTPMDGTSAATHYFYDIRQDAFFADSFADVNMNPKAVCTIDGDEPGDRCLVLGGFDGRIRKIDYEALSDDTEAIDSYVWIGPLKADEGTKVRLNELRGTLDLDSDSAYYEVYGSVGAQEAYERGQKFHSGVWAPGRNWSDCRRASGTAIYIKVGNSDYNATWSYENIFASLQACGLSASRRAV